MCLSDEMLREVIVLCKTTSEGQARASACELLHAIFLVSVANENNTSSRIKVLFLLHTYFTEYTVQPQVGVWVL